MFFVTFLIFLNFPPRSLTSKKTLFYCVAFISFAIVALCGGWVEVVVYCVWSVFSYVYFYVCEGSPEKIIKRIKLVLKKY